MKIEPSTSFWITDTEFLEDRLEEIWKVPTRGIRDCSGEDGNCVFRYELKFNAESKSMEERFSAFVCVFFFEVDCQWNRATQCQSPMTRRTGGRSDCSDLKMIPHQTISKARKLTDRPLLTRVTKSVVLTEHLEMNTPVYTGK